MDTRLELSVARAGFDLTESRAGSVGVVVSGVVEVGSAGRQDDIELAGAGVHPMPRQLTLAGGEQGGGEAEVHAQPRALGP